MNKYLLLAAVILAAVTVSFANETVKIEGVEYVITPHGLRLPQCVMEVPHNSFVSEHSNGAKLSVKTGEGADAVEKLFDVPKECHKDVENVRAKLNQKYLRQQQQKNQTAAPFPLNGWLDYTGWYPPNGQNKIEKFTSTYTTPQNPSVFGSQVLFYFIGSQDNDDPNLVNIVQPVLTWGNGAQQWYVKSWICCPSNITVSSPPIYGINPGNVLYGTIERTSSTVWRVDSEFNGQHTTLNGQVGPLNYNWADVTLEVYNVNQCGHFANGQFTASNLALYDSQGTRLTPSWQYTSPTACNGRVYSTNPTTLIISHN